ncbi:MAG TPA: hypothetical protein VE545_06435 [Candidatus Dormibacteraeota bacterium]|nr:hypothetical protein [Candidatus Dormibacteraeota bacterium]
MRFRFPFKLFSRQIAALAVVGAIGTAGTFITKSFADDDRGHRFQFAPDSLVLSRTVYTGTAASVTIGETLPLGCPAGPNGTFNVAVPTTTPGTTTAVAVTCGVASDNGEFPNLNDSHNVWNNSASDGSFGITSPIFLDNISSDGRLLDSLQIPSDKIVTSFSSKSELALNRSVDGKSITFMAYRGGPGCGGFPVSPTAVNLIDVSASSTPAICDPTNPVISNFSSTPVVPTAYYRAVAEVDGEGHMNFTDGNAYSGDNGRAAIKGGNGLYYMVGNDNSGNLSKKQLPITPIGIALINATGAELLAPLGAPPVPPNIGMIGRLQFGSDKPGKDTNFRGLTIFNNTLYVTKGSGGNGINTVYQAGSAGVLPTGSAADLASVPLAILPGFPNTTASTSTAFPFGIWFANATTLYVCDEGDGALVNPAVNGNVADALSLATAGLQKWSLVNGTWTMLYVLQDGLNIGVPYSVANYPAALNPATGGCRNITGRHNADGTVTIYAVTSTISANGDTGADPNKLVKVRDSVSATTLPVNGNGGDHGQDKDERIGHFVTIRSAAAGEVFRGVALAPQEDDRQ